MPTPTTVTGNIDAPLTIADALLTPAPATTNNWGVDRDYALGMIQTWNATVTKNFTQDWTMQVGYTGVKGTDLDILRAPALGANGEPIPETQAFIWESSGGRSLMNAANVQVRRRLAGGLTGGASYTFAHAMDNASSLGAGGAVVAQNDKDLEAEYARSTFERRQQISGNLYYELPWGPNRRWLKDGGHLATIFGEWSAQFTVTVQSGVPLTARVLGSASDLLRGVNGSLRANYNGAGHRPQQSDGGRVLQHHGVQPSRARHIRHLVAKHDHRARLAAIERPLPARYPLRKPFAHAAGQRQQPAQHGPVGEPGHQRQFADVW